MTCVVCEVCGVCRLCGVWFVVCGAWAWCAVYSVWCMWPIEMGTCSRGMTAEGESGAFDGGAPHPLGMGKGELIPPPFFDRALQRSYISTLMPKS